MRVKPLNTIAFETIIDCFNEAFANYFVKMPTEADYYRNRWKAAKVDYNLSFGMFDNDQLVGFIIHAIDTRNNKLTAYNSGTGVIPGYRGKHIVSKIYEYAIPVLKEHGIELCTLEVIQENVKAIKAYEGVGFSIRKNYLGFGGTIAKTEKTFDLEKVDLKSIKHYATNEEKRYSWDYHLSSLVIGKPEFFKVSYNQKDIGFFIVNTSNNYIAQLEILDDTPDNWERIFNAIATIAPTTKIINVDDRFTSKIEAIKSSGLTNIVNQYEMELAI